MFEDMSTRMHTFCTTDGNLLPSPKKHNGKGQISKKDPAIGKKTQDRSATGDAKKAEPPCKKSNTRVEVNKLGKAEGERLEQHAQFVSSDGDETTDHVWFIFPRPTRLCFFCCLFFSRGGGFIENT